MVDGGHVVQEFSTTLYLRQVWRDERLAFPGNRNVTLNHKQFDRMWTPDVFIRNLKAGSFHTITVPNRLIRLSPDGTILYSQRLTLTLSCDMMLIKYPMDNQTCKIEFGSCQYIPSSLHSHSSHWSLALPARMDVATKAVGVSRIVSKMDGIFGSKIAIFFYHRHVLNASTDGVPLEIL